LRLSGKAWSFIFCLGLAFVLTTFRIGGTLPEPPDLKSIPLRISAWEGTEESLTGNVLNLLGVDRYIFRVYRSSASMPAWLYIGYYRSQAQGRTIHSPQHCYPGSGWSPVESSEEDLSINRLGRTIRIRRFVVGKDADREIVYYWYQERDRIVANEYMAKAYLFWDGICRGRSDGALVRFSLRSGGDIKKDSDLLRGFVSEMFPLIEDALRRQTPLKQGT
jgi:EpsI family protein